MLDSVFKRLPIKECYFVTDTTASRTLRPTSKWYFSKMRIVQILKLFIEIPHNRVSKLGRHALCRPLQNRKGLCTIEIASRSIGKESAP